MVTRFEAYYPFTSESRRSAEEYGAQLGDLLTNLSFEDARIRGCDRVEKAILESEVKYTPVRNEVDMVMEIMSYPYARIIVSAINDKFLTKRYALAEAVHMNKLLGQESFAGLHKIASELDVKTRTVDDQLQMHFSDYLKLSNRIKSTDWKLVNTEIRNGFVLLSKERFTRVLQNALQDRIESELPMKLPDDIKAAVKKDADRLTNILEGSKAKFNVTFTGELKPELLPPCIRTLLANAQNGMNLPHSGRFAVVSFLHAIGMNSQQILALFAQSPDFDESKSIYQIKHITGELNGTDGYTPPECGTMKTNGICYDPDQLCARDTMNHPLTYFRIKSGKPYQGDGNKKP